MDGWTLPGKGFEDRVSLSVALASVAVKPSSCPDISVGWSPFSSRGFPPDFTMSVSDGAADTPHKKARTSPYPGSTVERTAVPDEKVSWLVERPEHKLSSTLLALSWQHPGGQIPLPGKGTSLLNLTKRMGMLKEGAGPVCMRLKTVDPEILQVRQGWLAEGSWGVGVPIRLQIPS